MKVQLKGIIKRPYEFQDSDSGDVLRGFKLAYMGGSFSITFPKENKDDYAKLLPHVGKEIDFSADLDIEPAKTAGLSKGFVSNIFVVKG